ncbi:hypothetical protein M408DRAFT_326736 [Serendipita vermifera MAFF 305830]|uniref:Inactive metallocarboxypeptidase ECM14 n=1 Tax=Serendipita vermifera MAFF 305830 TaxID=933852 RepID=A0A0C2X4N0_SERVB|nr:hypothetical protein M408DRAFT_326736 [Serendipita vermifera MAFF 305830]
MGVLACAVETIAGQLPLRQNDVERHMDALHDHSIVSGSIEGEFRRYPFTRTLLETLQHQDVDIWRSSSEHIDAYIKPENLDDLSLLNMNYTVVPIVIPKMSLPGDEDASLKRPCSGRHTGKKSQFNLTYISDDFHSQYHSAANITRFMRSLVHTFPNHTSLFHVGHSSEGRRIVGIKIVSPEPVPVGKKGRKAMVILGAQHAREWIATSTALYLAHVLAVDPAEQGDHKRHALRRLLDHFEFHIIPLPNPDGYEYTRKHDRLWYKNRQTVSDEDGQTVCKGIDMNRNWGYEWLPANDPASGPCRHWFPGSRPFESHEVNALASYLTHQTGGKGHVVSFLDLRSYGQTLSAPFSYSCDLYPADAEDQIEAALGAAQASSRVHGISVSTGRLCETLYSAPGNIIDWAYAVAGIKYSYAAHLRDTGIYGFLLPQEMIRPTGEEAAALVDYLATFISRDPKTMR